MLNNFLRDAYKLKVVSKEVLQNKLQNWKISQSNLTKTFLFEDFNHAMQFTTLAGEFLKGNKIDAKVVEISIEENILKHLTTRELKAATYLDQVGGVSDIIENLISTDYTISHFAFPQRYSLDVASLTATDPWQDKEKYLITSEKASGLKLL